MSERYLALPLSMLREMREHLTGPQQLAFIALLEEANYKPGTVVVRGQRIALDVGETLLAQRGFAERHGIKRGQVRRLLERLEALGWIRLRPAVPGPQTGPGTGPAPGPPPTILRVRKWRRIIWSNAQAGPGPGPETGPEAGPILPSTPYPVPNYFSLARENKDALHERERECSLEDIDRILRPWKERKHG
jgi:hypothetical protein